MKEQLSIIAIIICRLLALHWLNWSKHWHHNGQIHAPCKLCSKIISK